MSMTTLACEERRGGLAVRLADYLELTKPRIATLVLVTVAVAGFVASWSPASWSPVFGDQSGRATAYVATAALQTGGVPPLVLLLHALLGTALVAASASALNQWLERESDARMARTADRPLPAGRLGSAEVLVFAGVTIALGFAYLALAVNWRTAWLGLITWVVYAWIYTPLKSRTSANTAVGAVSGALPVLMGWSAVGGTLGIEAFALFLIVFIWQFPHFMAIAWIYRRQYADAGLQMLSVVDPSGRRAGAQAVVSALVLVPVSLVPAVLGARGELYCLGALVLGVAQLACAVGFLVNLDDASARRLLRASLIYLPAVLLLLVLGPLV